MVVSRWQNHSVEFMTVRFADKPLKFTVYISVSYIVVSLVYIILSTWIAASLADDVETLARNETIKGVLFVVTTGVFIFGASYFFLRRLYRQMEHLAAREKELDDAERRTVAKTMVSSIAHDSNNMLSSILFGADLMRMQGDLSEKQSHTLRQIHNAGQQIRELNNRLIAATRRRADLPLENVAVTKIFEEVADFVKTAPQTAGVSLVFKRTDESVRIRVNRHLMLQALHNLVINAADAAGDNASIELSVRVEGDRVHLEIHDNGPGVPEEIRDRIFHPFFSRKENGQGLGLVAVKACAESFGGVIEVDDSPLGGACFRLVLPLVRE